MALADAVAAARTAVQQMIQDGQQLDTQLAAIQTAEQLLPPAITQVQSAVSGLTAAGVATDSDVITKLNALITQAQSV